jgi:hypothetical protein
MHRKNLSDELSIDLLADDFNVRSFLMYLRRENERNREIYTSRQHPSKYSAFDNSRGFARLIEFQSSNSSISSYMTSDKGMMITENLSQQLLDDNLILVRHHWQRSKMTLTKKIDAIQSEFNLQANTSLKRTINDCHKLFSNWISKNRLR